MYMLLMSTWRPKTANLPNSRCLCTLDTKPCSLCYSNLRPSSNLRFWNHYKLTLTDKSEFCLNFWISRYRDLCHQLTTLLWDFSTFLRWTSRSRLKVCWAKMYWLWTSNIFWIRCTCNSKMTPRTAWSSQWTPRSTGWLELTHLEGRST